MNALIIQPNPHHQITIETNLFLEHVAMTKSASTLKTYAANTNAFVVWLLDQDTNKGLKSHLEAYKSHIGMKYGSARSKNLNLSIVRSLFKYLLREGVIKENPAESLENFKVPDTHSKSALSKYQLHDLLQHLETLKLRDRVLMSLLISNGLRANEASNILIEDIKQHGENIVIFLLRKGYSDKSCFTILNEKTYALIRELVGDRTEGYLFQSQKGGGITTTSLSKLVKKIFRDAGIDESSITCHSCRHTTAILALKAGANIMQVSQMLNHKNLSSTNVYLKSYDRAENPAEKMFSIYDQ